MRIEAALGRTISLQFRDLLKITNGPSLFDKRICFNGAVENILRRLRLEDQVAVSLLFENEMFSLTRRTRWNAGWMKIGVVNGWDTQHQLEANFSGKCAIVSRDGASVGFSSFSEMLDFIVGIISPIIPCSGLAEDEYGPLEFALCNLFSTD